MASLQQVDDAIFTWVNKDLSNPFFDLFFPAITDLNKYWEFKFVLIPLILILLVYFQRQRGLGISIGLTISLGLADLLGNIAKHFWQRPRPFHSGLEVIQRSQAGGFSFPSNHSVNMFCMAFFMSAFFPKWKWVFMIFAFLVAFSRVYDGVHYPLDILVGGFLGAFVGILGAEITQRMLRTWKHRREMEKNKHV